eukprot:scaffold2434_cov116-Isochrysis_galbana.AAC.5
MNVERRFERGRRWWETGGGAQAGVERGVEPLVPSGGIGGAGPEGGASTKKGVAGHSSSGVETVIEGTVDGRAAIGDGAGNSGEDRRATASDAINFGRASTG